MDALTREFMAAVESEVRRARGKFPSPNCNLAALTEEVGELARALLSERSHRVVTEAIQVAAMAVRCGTEGDPTLDAYRIKLGLEPTAKEG